MARALERRGRILDRINGAHHVYRRPDRPEIIPVPIHGNRDLAKGTQRDIMRTAGLSDDDP